MSDKNLKKDPVKTESKNIEKSEKAERKTARLTIEKKPAEGSVSETRETIKESMPESAETRQESVPEASETTPEAVSAASGTAEKSESEAGQTADGSVSETGGNVEKAASEASETAKEAESEQDEGAKETASESGSKEKPEEKPDQKTVKIKPVKSEKAAKKNSDAEKKKDEAGKKETGSQKKKAGAEKKETGAQKKDSGADKKETGAEKKSSGAGEKNGNKDKKRRRQRIRQNRRNKPGGKSFEMKMPGKKVLMIAGGIAGGIVVIYLGISAYFISHFYMNTEINGQDFSGKTVEDVKEYIQQQVSDYTLTVREQNNEISVISGNAISLSYKENEDITQALESQNPLLWPSAFFSTNAADVTVDVSYNEEALTEQIQSLNAVTKEQTQPESAHPEYNGESYVIKAETAGTAINMDVLTEKVGQYITEFREELVLRDEGCYVLPEYTSTSPEVQGACDTMNRYISASITYTMDSGDVVLDKEDITEWVSCSADMEVTLDEDGVRAWMRQFGKTYDTVGTTRSITTPTGKTAQVSGGTYGWSVNEANETEKLIENIKNGDVTSREPEYNQTAASHSEQDWGNTYLEVDMSAQHMWYIKNGTVVLESDVVTGRPTDDRSTPQGVYSIIEMKRDKVLTGSIDPSTGEPSYRTPVSYWMRITWTGIGFHDATWQAQFGGDWYVNHGSHGCINMPLSKAADLYGMLEMGTPAIVHY